MTREAVALVALALAACVSAPPARPAPSGGAGDLVSATALFERHVRAIGGDRAITTKTKATIHFAVSYPSRGVKGTGTLDVGGGRAHLEMALEGIGKVERDYEGDTWATDLHFDAHLPKHFENAKTVAKRELDGLPVFDVEATGPDGKVTLTFDANQGYLVRRSGEVETPDGKMSATTQYADYQDFGGVRCARLVTQRTGDRVQVIEVQSIDMQ